MRRYLEEMHNLKKTQNIISKLSINMVWYNILATEYKFAVVLRSAFNSYCFCSICLNLSHTWVESFKFDFN